MSNTPEKKTSSTSDDQTKDPLDVSDLPEQDTPDDPKGGYYSRPIMKTAECNSNTLTCKDTSSTNTLCCE